MCNNPIPINYKGTVMQVPCNKCLGCKSDFSSYWSWRCQLESKLHDESCVVTLTYNDESLPRVSYSADLQCFFKRLRKYAPLRFFASFEYGGVSLRPHMHVILFGISRGLYPSFFSLSKNSFDPKVMHLKCWPYGHIYYDDLSEQSIRYVCAYLAKQDVSHKARCPSDQPEFIRMSRKPGLGRFELEMNRQHYMRVGMKSGVKSSSELYSQWLPQYARKVVFDSIYKDSDLKEAYYKDVLREKNLRRKPLDTFALFQREKTLKSLLDTKR